MLFRITTESVFEDNPHLKLLKEFKGITDQQFRYVAFYSDWQSPYRNLDHTERSSRSMDISGLDTADGLDAYIEAYYDIQGIGAERRNIDAIDSGLEAIRSGLMDAKDKEPDDIKKLTTALVELTKQRKVLIKMINEQRDLQDGVETNEMECSLIDEYR
jgi:hypothetical protein